MSKSHAPNAPSRASSTTEMGSHPRSATTARYTKSLSQPIMKISSRHSGATGKQCQYHLTYIGALQLDRRVTDRMLRWVLVDIKRSKEARRKGIMTIRDSHVRFISQTDSSDVLLEHNVHSISQFCRCQRDRRCLFYLQRNSIDAPFVMFAFLCEQEDKVVDIFNSIQECTKNTKKPDSFYTSSRKLLIHKTFEVRYQGRCHIGERKKSGAFIDSWLLGRQSRLLDQREMTRHRHCSDSSRHRSTTVDTPSVIPEEGVDEGRIRRVSEGDERSERDRHDSSSSSRSASSSRSEDQLDTLDSGVGDALAGDLHNVTRQSSVASSNSVTSDIFDEVDERDHRRSTLITTSDTNKTMLFQIDDDKMSIISLDKKSIILEKTFKEISYCTQGAKFTDHFGFICYDSKARREERKDQYIMYIFQCASDNVITEVMDTLKKAFASVLKRNQEMQSCEFCPMTQYHKLCEDLTYIKDNESAYNCVQNHILNLPMSEYTDLMNKVRTEQCISYEEANDVLMTKLRIMCEIRQIEHVHGKDTDFNIVLNRQSKLNVLKNRAKKALAFDMFGKKSQESEWRPKGHNQIPDLNLNDITEQDIPPPSPSPTTKHSLASLSEALGDALPSPGRRARSHTASEVLNSSPSPSSGSAPSQSSGEVVDKNTLLQKLTNMGHSLEEAMRRDKFSSPDKNSIQRKQSMPAFLSADAAAVQQLEITGPMAVRKKHRRMSSWRRDIFQSVVASPNKNNRKADLSDTPVKRSLGGEELRAMWRSAIEQTILLNRMEKENTNLREHEEKMKQKRAQLNYQDVTPCHDEVVNKWRSLLGKVKTAANPDHKVPKIDLWNLVKEGPSSLREMVKNGVPRPRRGEIWKLLARQYTLSSHGFHSEAEERPTEMVEYKELLHGLTPHQHAILIDLGRTFPQHDYFKTQLGAGQLSLFNILKAYSLVDTEVGYCQGLGFVAGILLMHVEEEETFELLCHLMYDLGLRKLYKPNMAGLQVSMYQLARLMRDRHTALYEHLEGLDIMPALYAAPWFITLFSSQFTIGFVSRVYDFLFMEGYAAVFKIALALLDVHEKTILASDSFETTTETLKQTLPEMSAEDTERVFEKANSLDLANDLYTYQIEYHVMEEDIMDSADNTSEASVSKLEQANIKLKEQNAMLADKLNTSSHKLHNRETMIDALQQSHAKLTKQVRSLEQERSHQHAIIERLKEFAPPNILRVLETEQNLISQLSTDSAISVSADSNANTPQVNNNGAFTFS